MNYPKEQLGYFDSSFIGVLAEPGGLAGGSYFRDVGAGVPLPSPSASAGAGDLGIFVLLGLAGGPCQGMDLQEGLCTGGCSGRRALPQLRVSLRPSQASSSQIYPRCGIPENLHGMISPVLQEGAHQGDRGAALTAAARDGAALPAVSTLTLCLQVISPLFTESRLIHSLIISLPTYLSSPCQVPSGYPFSLAPGSPCRGGNQCFLLICKAEVKPCGVLFFPF